MPLRELFKVYDELDSYFGDFKKVSSFSVVDKDKIDNFFSLYPEVTDFQDKFLENPSSPNAKFLKYCHEKYMRMKSLLWVNLKV